MARFASDLLTADNLIGPNKDQHNFGLLKARDLIRTIMGWGPFRAAAGPYLIRSINSLPRSGLNKGPYEIRPVKILPRSGPNYGPDQVRPFKRLWAKLWPISDLARQLDAMLLGPLAKGPFSNSA